MTHGECLAHFAASTTYEDLPAEVVKSIKLRYLDTIGLALAATDTPAGRASLRVVGQWQGPPEASPIGLPGKFPPTGAALVCGTLAHALDFDDTHVPSILHPSAVVVPTALAVGEALGAEGPALIAAAAVGHEVCVRLGMAAYDRELRNSVFFEKGLHATSICGTLAAAVTAARLMGADEAEICHAMGVAASMGAGLLEANRTGGLVKQLHCGWAAHAGIAAAQLALSGFTAPLTFLEGRFGFFQALCEGRYDPDVLLTGLGDRWEAVGTFFKPYPANIFTHTAIDAAMQFREEGVDVSAIERVDLGVAAATLRTIAEPREQKIEPPTGYAARFSGPFTIATALLGGGGLGVYLDDFEDHCVTDRSRLDLAKRVYCHADAGCETIFPFHFPAVLRLTMRSGQVLEKRVTTNRGSTARPLSREDIRLKFRLNAERTLPAPRLASLMDCCEQLGADGAAGALYTALQAE